MTPFQAMTIGGWCLGNAWLALITARRWAWPKVSAALAYLWIGILETIVLIAFIDKLLLAAPIAWLYLITLGVNILLALLGGIWLLGGQAKEMKTEGEKRPVPRLPIWAFVVFVGFLGLYGLFAPADGPGLNAGIFPEILSTFTLRAFGAFYLSLALGGTMLLLLPAQLSSALHYDYAAFGLIIFISIAFIAYWSLFDLSSHPFQLLYPGAYIIAGAPLLLALIRVGTGNSNHHGTQPATK